MSSENDTLSNAEYGRRLVDGLVTFVGIAPYNTYASLLAINDAVQAFPEQNWLDAFSKYQLLSKYWLIQELGRLPNIQAIAEDHGSIYVIGGWVGHLAFMMRACGGGSVLPWSKIVSIDIDPTVHAPAELLNQAAHLDNWRFKSVQFDAMDLNYTSDSFPTGNIDFPILMASAKLVINTSCEHLENYQDWIAGVPKGMTVVLQSNNMFGIDGHVNCKFTLQEFKESCGLDEIQFCDQIDLGDSWKRYMIIGRKAF